MKKHVFFLPTFVAFLVLSINMLDAQGVQKGRGHREWDYDANSGQAPTFDANGHVKKFRGYANNTSTPEQTAASSSGASNRQASAPKKYKDVDDAFAQVANRSRANGAVSPTSNRYVAPRPVTFSSQSGLAQTSYERKRVDPSPKTDVLYANNGLVKGKVTLGVGDNKVSGSQAATRPAATAKPKAKPSNSSTIDSPRF